MSLCKRILGVQGSVLDARESDTHFNPVVIIQLLPHQRQPGLATRHGNTREDGHPPQRSRPDALVHALWRAGWGDLRVCRLLWGRFASPAVGPATLVWRRDGEPPSTPERLS